MAVLLGPEHVPAIKAALKAHTPDPVEVGVDVDPDGVTTVYLDITFSAPMILGPTGIDADMLPMVTKFAFENLERQLPKLVLEHLARRIETNE